MRWISGIRFLTLLAAVAALGQSRSQVPTRALEPEATSGYVAETTVRTARGPEPVRVEVRNWIIRGHVRLEKLPVSGEGTIVAQVRGGELTTIIGDRRQERREGDFFTVPAGTALGVETEDDSAVLQTIRVVRLPG